MDVFSHFVLPYLVVFALSRHHRAALAAGVGGVAPDLDAVTAIVALWDPLYFLGHRGLSHSLVGAPLYALAFVLLLRAPFWRRFLPIAELVRFPWPLALVAVAFSGTHLALDGLTHWGVPILYPWSTQRVSAGWFFYSVTAMIPVSMWMVWRIVRAKDTLRARRVGLALLLAIALVAGGVRAATYPRGEGFELAQPAAGEWAWNAIERTELGWRATFHSWGREVGRVDYLEPPVRDPAAQDALARAREHVEYKAFHLYAGGPEVTQVAARDDGGWNVTFLDLMQRAQADRSGWFPFSEEAGVLRFAVHPDGRLDEL